MRQLTLVLGISGLLLWSFGTASAQSPTLEVSAPVEGSTVEGTNVTVTFDVSGLTIVPSTVPLERAGQQPEANRPGEGHVHLMLDLGSLVVWSTTDPYVFTDVPPGEHQLMVELVNNDHSSLSPAVVHQLRFRTSASQLLPRTGGGHRDPTPMYAGLLGLSGLAILGAGLVLRRRVASR